MSKVTQIKKKSKKHITKWQRSTILISRDLKSQRLNELRQQKCLRRFRKRTRSWRTLWVDRVTILSRTWMMALTDRDPSTRRFTRIRLQTDRIISRSSRKTFTTLSGRDTRSQSGITLSMATMPGLSFFTCEEKPSLGLESTKFWPILKKTGSCFTLEYFWLWIWLTSTLTLGTGKSKNCTCSCSVPASKSKRQKKLKARLRLNSNPTVLTYLILWSP